MKTCETCQGWGTSLDTWGAEDCPDCNGKGKIIDVEGEMRENFFDPRFVPDETGVSHLEYTVVQGLLRLITGLATRVDRLRRMRLMLLDRPWQIGKRNRVEWAIGEFRVGAEHNNEGEKVGGFNVRVELRDFGSECPPRTVSGRTWPDRLLHPLYLLLPLERLLMLTCYTPEGYRVGDLDTALIIYGAWGLTDVQPVAVAAGKMTPEEAAKGEITCGIGYDPEEKRWVGWSHRASASFGIGHVVEKGDAGARGQLLSMAIDGAQPPHPRTDSRVPIGFEVKTLDDARWCAIAYADSIS